jgi:hypothetical protein
LVVPPFEGGAAIAAGDAALHYVVQSIAEYEIPLLFLNILPLLRRRIPLYPLPTEIFFNTRASTELSPFSAVLYGRVPNPSVALFFRVAGLFRKTGGFGTRHHARKKTQNGKLTGKLPAI